MNKKIQAFVSFMYNIVSYIWKMFLKRFKIIGIICSLKNPISKRWKYLHRSSDRILVIIVNVLNLKAVINNFKIV